MTVQELLLLDSTMDIRIGVGKLQQILNTMKVFKNEVLELNEVVSYHKNEVKTLEERLHSYYIDNVGLLKDKAILQERLTRSIDEVDELKGELKKVRDEAELLRNTRMRLRAIDLSLEGLDDL